MVVDAEQPPPEARLARVLPALSSPRLVVASLVGGALWLGFLFYRNTVAASRVVDGMRWFWLDDDQMISMRYARNLVEGHGLSWNPGERVEGYTNFGWTLIMAAVHATGIDDRRSSLAMVGVSLACMLGVTLLSVRLLRLLVPEPRAAVIATVVCLVTCVDVVWWAENGHETVLVALLQLVFVTEVVAKRASALGYVALSLIPLVRGDGLHVFAGNAILVLYLSHDRRRTALWLLAAIAPTLLHFAFRYGYYGEWLPNTYYVKTVGLPDKHLKGWRYVRNFALEHAVTLCLAAGAVLALAKRERGAWALVTSLGATTVYCILVGGDNFPGFRFFSHVLPLVLVFAAAGGVHVAKRGVGQAVWYAVLFAAAVPLVNPVTKLTAFDDNGDPERQVVVAALLRKNAAPESSVAVVAAGIVPYFTRLKSFDVLGKNDRHIAHLPYQPGGLHAHGKLDPEYTLAQAPDFVVSYSPANLVASAPERLPPEGPFREYVLAFLATPTFRASYLAHPVKNAFLAAHTQLYIHRGSPERDKRTRWGDVTVEP
jgi:hypothetical protein